MAFAAVGGVRTIWIIIRGRNYARQAMKNAQGQLSELQKAQDKFRRSAQMTIFSGLLMVTMFALIGGAMFALASKTRYARTMLRGFNRTAKRFLDVFGKEFLITIRPILNSLEGLMKMLMKNRVALRMIIGAVVGLMIIGTLNGMIKMLNGLLSMLAVRGAFFVNVAGQMVERSHTLTIAGRSLTVTWTGLQVAISRTLAVTMIVFTIFSALEAVFGGLTKPIAAVTAVILALVTAMLILKAIATSGASLAGDLAVIAAGSAIGAGLYAAMPSYQQGTMFASKTGPAMIHEGERIIPRETVEKAMLPPLGFKEGETPSVVNVTVNVDRLMTKADEEELTAIVWGACKKALDDAEFGD